MDLTTLNLESVLRLIAQTSPNPWYPKQFLRFRSDDRDQLNQILNDLRIAGLVRMTDWERETGQGYLVTKFGQEVLDNPQFLSRLRKGLPPENTAEESLEIEPGESRSGRPTTFERGEAVRNALLMPDKPQVTPTLIIFNIIGFVISGILAIRAGVGVGQFLSVSDPRVITAIHEAGALRPGDLANGEWWRLITCCFLHFGIFHIFMNMYSLYATGNKLETLWGVPRYLVIYLFSGLGGATAAMIYDPGLPGQQKLLAGASGAIWGLMTSAGAWIFLNREFIPKPLVSQWFRQWWMVILFNVAVSFLPNISASAHFGGGAAGLLISVLLHYQRYGTPLVRQLTTALVALFPVVCIAWLNQSIETDPRWKRIVQQQQQIAKAEARDRFIKKVRNNMAASISGMEIVDDQVMKLINREKTKRTDEELKEVRSAISKVKTENEQVLPDFPDKAVNEAIEAYRKLGREYLDSSDKLLDQFSQFLDRDPPTREEMKTLREMRNEVVDKANTWSRAVNR